MLMKFSVTHLQSKYVFEANLEGVFAFQILVLKLFFLDFLQKKHHLCLDILNFVIFVHH